MKININNREIDLRFKFRAELLFEDALEHSFKGENIKEWITYMFCTVIANTEDGFISYADFMEFLDNNMDVFYEFIQWYTEVQQTVIDIRSQKIKKNLEEKKKVKKTSKK